MHFIDRGVDTGQVLGRVYPELTPGDGELGVERKIAAMLAILGSEVVEWVRQGGKLAALNQSGPGLNFRSDQRTLRAELSYLCRCALRQIRIPARAERIDRYFDGRTEVS